LADWRAYVALNPGPEELGGFEREMTERGALP
jgi:hypothetical protein